MAQGFVLDKSHNKEERLKWIEGPAEKSRWGGYVTKDRRAFEVVAFRCPRCAWVIWFAPDAAES
jgi:hypothetical protein